MVGTSWLRGLSGIHQQHLGLFSFCSRWHLQCQLEWQPIVVGLPLAFRVKVLVIYSSPWITILFCSYNHCAAPISRHDHRYWGHDTFFNILPKGLLYWFFEVERHRNWAVPGFRDCPPLWGEYEQHGRT